MRAVQLTERQPGRWPGLVGAVSGGATATVRPRLAGKYDSVCLGPQGNSNIFMELFIPVLLLDDLVRCCQLVPLLS